MGSAIPADESGTSTKRYYVGGDPLLVTGDPLPSARQGRDASESDDAGTSPAPFRVNSDPGQKEIKGPAATNKQPASAPRPNEDGTSTATVQPNVNEQASPEPPVRKPAVLFQLSVAGNQRAQGPDYTRAQAEKLFDDASRFGDSFTRQLRADYDFDVPRVFESLPDLLAQTPILNDDKRWQLIVLITHGTGTHRSYGYPPAIFFGDSRNGVPFDYSSSEIRDFIELPARRQVVQEFQSHVGKEARLIVIACGEGGNFVQLGADLRDLFGTSGETIMTAVDVGFPDAGGLAVREGDGTFRPFAKSDWTIIPAVRPSRVPLPDLKIPGLGSAPTTDK